MRGFGFQTPSLLGVRRNSLQDTVLTLVLFPHPEQARSLVRVGQAFTLAIIF
jgi:hypothetical protein